jgi:hypothetical protein
MGLSLLKKRERRAVLHLSKVKKKEDKLTALK